MTQTQRQAARMHKYNDPDRDTSLDLRRIIALLWRLDCVDRVPVTIHLRVSANYDDFILSARWPR